MMNEAAGFGESGTAGLQELQESGPILVLLGELFGIGVLSLDTLYFVVFVFVFAHNKRDPASVGGVLGVASHDCSYVAPVCVSLLC